MPSMAGCAFDATVDRRPGSVATHRRPPLPSGTAGAPAQHHRALDPDSRRRLEPIFGHDFSRVRIHTERDADRAAAAIDAQAFTVGNHIFFAAGSYAPHSVAGMRLLAHELAHTLQQRHHGSGQELLLDDRGDAAAERAATAAARGQHVDDVGTGVEAAIQRQRPYRAPGIDIRFPAAEEAVRQVAGLEPGGRPLTAAERRLVEPVFGRSVDLDRVRIVETAISPGTTVGNIIRIEPGFDIRSPWDAEVLIHEMAHVWQYQHGGTGYISVALRTQISASIRTGSRNEAYDYVPDRSKSFFDFTPEQQGLIVQNFFAMRRDQSAPAHQVRFRGNHMDGRGNFLTLDRARRTAEISAELPVHESYIGQLRASVPMAEWDILRQPSEFMHTPGGRLGAVPAEQEPVPLRPLLRIDF